MDDINHLKTSIKANNVNISRNSIMSGSPPSRGPLITPLSPYLTSVFVPSCPGDLHRDPDRASSSAPAAHGGSSDLSPAGSGPRGAHPLPSPLLQDPQQSAATTGVPPDPAFGPPDSGPL